MRTKAKEGVKAAPKAQMPYLGDRSSRAKALTASALWDPSSWPFSPQDVTPLEWWRTMPADHLGDAQHQILGETLDKVCLMQDRRWLFAMHGDAAASIAVAIETVPIHQITLEVDLAMTALMFRALDSSAGAALVLAHILRRAPLDHPFAEELSVSWLALNLRRALYARKHPTKTRLNSTFSTAASRECARPSSNEGM